MGQGSPANCRAGQNTLPFFPRSDRTGLSIPETGRDRGWGEYTDALNSLIHIAAFCRGLGRKSLSEAVLTCCQFPALLAQPRLFPRCYLGIEVVGSSLIPFWVMVGDL